MNVCARINLTGTKYMFRVENILKTAPFLFPTGSAPDEEKGAKEDEKFHRFPFVGYSTRELFT